MAASSARIVIVGCGPGHPDYATPAALRAIRQADILAGSRRLIDSFPGCGRERIVTGADVERTLDRLAGFLALGREVVVLVSGDPGLFSLARNVIHRFGRDSCSIVPGVSSVQVAFARLGLDWADAQIISAHGRTPAVSPQQLGERAAVAILAGTDEAMRWAASAAVSLAETHVAVLCESLTLPDERIRRMAPADLSAAAASSLAIVLLVRKNLMGG